MKSFTILATIFLVIISTILIYAQIEFSYSGSTGPAFWDRLEGSDKICRLGKNQSPIDITQEEIKKEGKLSVIGVFYDVADQQSNFFKPIITNVMKIYFL